MAQHARYTDAEKSDRVLIRFPRHDLLATGRIGDIDVPIAQDDGLVAGPTVLDIVERRSSAAGDVQWSLRGTDELLRRLSQGSDGGATPGGSSGAPRLAAASGGRPVQEEGGFLRVEKISSISIPAGVFRLAVKIYGSVAEAHKELGQRAAAAWERDLDRAREIHRLVKAAPGCRLAETPELAALRPSTSISAEIEADVLREVCATIGVDPDLVVTRQRGRPAQKGAGEADAWRGSYISISIDAAGEVTGKTVQQLADVPPFADLSVFTVPKLVSLLDKLVQDDQELDAQLLESFIDAADSKWRERMGRTAFFDQVNGTATDPYKIWGVAPDTPLEEIRALYKKAIQVMHPDKGRCPAHFAELASSSYQEILRQRRGDTDE